MFGTVGSSACLGYAIAWRSSASSSSLMSIAVTNTVAKSNVGEEKFSSSYTCGSQLVIEGSQGRKLKAGLLAIPKHDL